MPAVLWISTALEQSRLRESCEQLRDSRTGNSRASRELPSGQPLARDRAQQQVLRDGQRWLVRRQ
jgi:hypothetical protein